MNNRIILFLSVVMIMCFITGCGKQNKADVIISRTEKAIIQLQNDEISLDELSEKLKNINNYCEAYEEDDESYTITLCTTIYLYEYEASMSSASDRGIDYKYWDKALEELKDFRK